MKQRTITVTIITDFDDLIERKIGKADFSQFYAFIRKLFIRMREYCYNLPLNKEIFLMTTFKIIGYTRINRDRLLKIANISEINKL